MLLVLGACTGAASDVAVGPTATSTTSTTVPTTTTTAPPPVRTVADSGWTPFAVAGGLTLVHPAARVERIGLHESNHDGARVLEPAPTAVQAVTMEARDRGNGARTAADVVVDPTAEIRAPVSGRVKRAGTYVLYCEHSDDYVVIAPDANPAWEVKVLHIDGVQVRPGARVVAGQSVLAPRATQLPFESQVDELRTVDPAWPHVHIEVVDPSIKDRPNPNSGC